ncbi:MAG: hypothetical protein QOC81_2177 [Thermoanaerobaculia bacterium]|nr:hypothetical protein [Thermoanaerobaculia bacterium]
MACNMTPSVTPANPDAVNLIVLKLPKGLGYFDETIANVMSSSHVITISQNFDSEVNPAPVPVPDGVPLRCTALISSVGPLAAGDYTAKWVLHDTYWNTFIVLGELRFSVAAVIPAIPSAARPLLFAALATLGCIMAAKR